MKKLPTNLSAHQWRTLARLADALADRLTVIAHGWWQRSVFDERFPGTDRFERQSIYSLAGLSPGRAQAALDDELRAFHSNEQRTKRLRLWGECEDGIIDFQEYWAEGEHKREAIRALNQQAADELVRLAERCLRNASKPKPSMPFEQIRKEGYRLIHEEHRRFPSKNKFATAIGCSPSSPAFKRVVKELGGDDAILSTKENHGTVSATPLTNVLTGDNIDIVEVLAAEEELEDRLAEVRELKRCI